MSDSLPPDSPNGVADAVAFITSAASVLIAQKWGVRAPTVHKALSTPEAVAVTTTRYLLALGTGKTPAEAAGDVGRSLLANANQRAA
ncbi:hypothetical protein MHW47_29480 [Streptomyces sp. OfavH-34-F]|uniref:hypothetical protein n=1 Tax=Streptomyces sp. OfavH-34-F TaxID=2917760 RepID=UPI001EF3BC3D|nr:hypothetical protein [Streptomyces sp. OfavH-34-F]MCG7528561.1 hypothetical protein [Streptomyces sp. OfavH-34-F]